MVPSPPRRSLPDLASALREFARLQTHHPDPRLRAWTSLVERTGDPRYALLAASLSQDLTIPAVERLLRELDATLGPALLEPWTLRQESLDKICRLPWLHAWPHRDALAGWITAAGDFLRDHGPAQGWKTLWPEPRDFVRTLALRIPWMGRKSTERVKGWRLARWLVRGEGLGEPLWPESSRAALRLPYPVLATPLGWFSNLPPGWEGRSPRDRQAWVDTLATRVDASDPAAIWAGLESILRRGRTDHQCVERLGSCGACPLEPFCKS